VKARNLVKTPSHAVRSRSFTQPGAFWSFDSEGSFAPPDSSFYYPQITFIFYRVIFPESVTGGASMTERSILIVEDEGLIALHLMEILTNAGYRIQEPVPSGEDALRHVKQIPRPDLILMDITLDGQLDGIETASRIRERYDIPVIFLTAHSNDTIMARAKDASPCGYIIKPVIEKDLLVQVEKALNQKNQK
jgi:two-component system, response regulator PdtaR